MIDNQSEDFAQGPAALDRADEIAIVGMACRFPGAPTIDRFWCNLRDGVESISFFSDEELESSGVPPATLKDPGYVKAGGIVEDIDLFDAGAFGMSPREAEITDPQHRLFLECASEALENGGYDPSRYKRQIGVFGGAGLNGYLVNLFSSGAVEAFDHGIMIGNEKDHLAMRVSYKLNLKGPSVTIQTACSTSLVAVHLACQSLLNGQCDMALAGGVSLRVPMKTGYFYTEGGINSPDGHCRAFDAKAQGTVGGSGAGVVLLKRMEDALADGDRIRAVIKGSAINNDGSMKVGYAAPSEEGQAEVISDALAMAGVRPEQISYVEAHGTGTALGDPIEIAALTQVFRGSSRGKTFCGIGSVKSNIGHLDTAAGVAGLIKTVLAFENSLLPPSLHFSRPNPQIPIDNSPFYVNTTLSEWKGNGTPRRAGVSSFGIGGTNAHVVLEEAPLPPASGPGRPGRLLVLSAHTATALETATANLHGRLKANPDLSLDDTAYTLQIGRKAWDYRRAIVCDGRDSALDALQTLDPKRVISSAGKVREKQVCFLFPGQGSQYPNMGLGLYESEPAFRRHVDLCSEALIEHLGFDLREVLYPGKVEPGEADRRLGQTCVTQPALFVIEYSLVKMWEQWGIKPAAMIGHSIGEYVAACVAGVLSLSDALELVAERGRMIQDLSEGAMLAIRAREEDINQLLNGDLALAAVNGPDSCVVSGTSGAIYNLETRLSEAGTRCRRLRTSHAFHSHMMEPILETFKNKVRKLGLNAPQIEYISNVTGNVIKPEEAMSPDYWAIHLRRTVRFGEGLGRLLDRYDGVLLEVGPGQSLSTFASSLSKSRAVAAVSSLRHPNDETPDTLYLAGALGQLWVSGVNPHWEGLYVGQSRRRVSLPTYPFERSRYWIDSAPRPHARVASERPPESAARTDPPAKNPNIAEWFYAPVWKLSMPPDRISRDRHAGGQGRWLFFSDSSGLGPACAARLEEQGHSVFQVLPGDKFSRTGERSYELCPGAREQYDVLFNDLKGRGMSPEHIVHLWSVESNVESNMDAAPMLRLAKTQEAGCYSILFTTQAIGKQSIDEPRRLWIVSSGAHQVTGDETFCPLKATLLGFPIVIPQEYPSLHCSNVDIVAPAGLPNLKTTVDQLVTEILQQEVEPVVAYRGSRRCVRSFEKIRLGARPELPQALRQGGVYLITGGLGGIGLEIASYLARTVRAKLVLVGRSGLPERSEWGRQPEQGNQSEASALRRKIDKVLALEAIGSEVLIAKADVGELSQMKEVLRLTYERFGKIHGVIHSAGTAPGGLIQFRARDAMAAVQSSKVKGTLVLDRLLGDRDLDFFLACSSINSVVGVAGQADYIGANAFLDSFANWKTRGKWALTMSINWDTWSETGMAFDAAAANPHSPAFLDGISTDEGIDALARLLNTGMSQVVVSTRDLQQLLDWQNERRPVSRSLGEQQPGANGQPGASFQDASGPSIEQVEGMIARVWQEVLGVSHVGRDDNFFELGGDSILGLQIIARAIRLGIKLTPRDLLQFQTVAELAVVAERQSSVRPDQGAVSGPVPVTPAQHRVFAADGADVDAWSHPIALDAKQRIDASILGRAVHYILTHHDALRSRFHNSSGGWQATIDPPPETILLERIDRSDQRGESREHATRSECERLQRGLNLDDGPLFRAALLEFGEHEPQRLVIVVHHLVADRYSRRILVEDLSRVYDQLRDGLNPQLPGKTTSYKRWAERLVEYSRTSEVLAEAGYWLRQKPLCRLPEDQPEDQPEDHPEDRMDGSDAAAQTCPAQTCMVETALDETETRILTGEISSPGKTPVSDIVLTAVVLALRQWTGRDTAVIDFEHSGRSPLFESADLSRTVGLFTERYPVLLDVDGATQPEDALGKIRDRLRQVPRYGTGYAILRYLCDDPEISKKMQSLPAAEISFSYVEESDHTLGSFELIDLHPEPIPAYVGRDDEAIAIRACCRNDRLQISVSFKPDRFRLQSIEEFAGSCVAALRSLIDARQSIGTPRLTPSDFPLAGLSQSDLDDLIAEFGEAVE